MQIAHAVLNTVTTLFAAGILGGTLAVMQHYYPPAFPYLIGFMLACIAGRVLSYER